jgi:uncharacterized protein
MSKIAAGTIVSLWHYPVKSMMGEELNAADLSERGVAGDRAYALVDRSDGKVGSAKNPRKWPGLFDCRASFADSPRAGQQLPPVRMTLPDGRLVTNNAPDVNDVLSALVGRPVTLASTASSPRLEEYWPNMDGLAHKDTVTDEAIAMLAPPGTFFDCAPIHLLTTATLDRLRELYPRGRFEARRYRPNLVVSPPPSEKGFAELNWIGRTLAVGSEVRLSIVGPCPRCVMTTLAQGDLPNDPGILQTAALHTPRMTVEGFGELSANVGVYAKVMRGGRIRRGDAVALE